MVNSDQIRFINSLLNIRLPEDVSHLDGKMEEDFFKTKLLILSSGVLGALSFVLQALAFPNFAIGAAIFFTILIILMLFGVYVSKGLMAILLGANAFFTVVDLVSRGGGLLIALMLAMSIIGLCILLLPKDNTSFFVFKALKRGQKSSTHQIKREHDETSKMFDDW